MIKKIGNLSYISTRQDGSKYFKLLGEWENIFNNEILSNGINELVFGPGNWRNVDLGSFSSEIHAITFEEYFENDFLYSLNNLKSFVVCAPLITSLDFSKFKNILQLSLIFPKKHIVHKYPAALQSLLLEKYRKPDLKEFSHLTEINNFVVRFGCLSSFEGTEKWPLKKLSLFRTRNFSDYHQLSNFKQLEYLELMQCPEIKDISYLNSLKCIKEILLLDMNKVSLSGVTSEIISKIRIAGTTKERKS